MFEFDSDSIQKALDQLTEMHRGNDSFISVEFIADDPKIVIRYSDEEGKPVGVPSSIEVFSHAKESKTDISVFLITGPKIKNYHGDILTHPPLKQISTDLAGEMGGDQCRNANSMNYYGTITLYVGSIEIDASGHCGFRCGTSPALISNNHVIGRSDAGQSGEVIWTPFRSDVARLKCLVPFPCNSSTDIATATVNDLSGIMKGAVRTIGQIAGVRRPNIGEAIKKHGARSGYTTGSVTGQANIQVDGHLFLGVFSTTGGFGCPGDSGSAVVANNNDLLGMFSWGDDLPCENLPRGYFWTFVNPGTFAKSEDLSKCLISFNSE